MTMKRPCTLDRSERNGPSCCRGSVARRTSTCSATFLPAWFGSKRNLAVAVLLFQHCATLISAFHASLSPPGPTAATPEIFSKSSSFWAFSARPVFGWRMRTTRRWWASTSTSSVDGGPPPPAMTDADEDGAPPASSSYATVPPRTSPLPPHTFSGMVERALMERFFPDDGAHCDSNGDDTRPSPGPSRVLESWRLLEGGYVHDEFVGVTQMGRDAASSHCKQHCHSYVPGLTVREFWDVDDPLFRRPEGTTRGRNPKTAAAVKAATTWCRYLESKYPRIKNEFDRVTANLEQLQAQGNNVWAGALTDDASSYGEGWKTLVLMDRGRWDPVNVNLFPIAAQAVKDSGAPAVEVFFASMQPHSQIKPHSDFTNFVLTSHLALDVPYSGQNKCRIKVGDETREWINGKIMVFDTSLLHDAANDSDRTRYILMLRVWHPDLTMAEREALQFTYDCLEIPELVSGDPQEKSEAQEIADKLRSFPEIRRGGTSELKQGFGGSPSKGKKSKGRK